MAATKITSLVEVTGVDSTNDFMVVVDVSDTTMAVTGSTKKVQPYNLPISSGTQAALDLKAPLSGNLSQFASTTSAQMITLISDETGSGNLVFSNTPTFTTPILGVASATSINKLILTTPTNTATLTIADSGSLITSGAFSTTLTSTAATNVTLPISGTMATLNNPETFTYKRINPRTTEITSATGITPDVSITDDYIVTALATGITVNAPIGTPLQGQPLIIRFKDDGTSRSISWNSIFKPIGVTLPTGTMPSGITYVGQKYDILSTGWHVLAVGSGTI